VKRWMLVLAWFALQFVWNFLTKPTPNPDGDFLYKCLVAIGAMTSPIELFGSLIAMVIIWKQPWKRKPLADR